MMILVVGVDAAGAGVAVCVTTTAGWAACRMTTVWVPHAPRLRLSTAAAAAPMRTLVLCDTVAPCGRDPGARNGRYRRVAEILWVVVTFAASICSFRDDMLTRWDFQTASQRRIPHAGRGIVPVHPIRSDWPRPVGPPAQSWGSGLSRPGQQGASTRARPTAQAVERGGRGMD